MPAEIFIVAAVVEAVIIAMLLMAIVALGVRLARTKNLSADRKREDMLDLAHRLHKVGLGRIAPFIAHYAVSDEPKMRRFAEGLLGNLGNEWEFDAVRREVLHDLIGRLNADEQGKREIQELIQKLPVQRQGATS